MEKVAVELEANVDDAIKNVDRLNVSIKNVGSSSKKSSKELSAGAQIGNEGVKALDRSTNGLASAFVKVGKASKLSGKAMKTALISSGIGLAVVAISLIVEYWDDISETLGFVNKDLEKQERNLRNQNDLIDVKLGLLKQQQRLTELNGESSAEITAEYKKQLLIKQKININLLENLKTSLEIEKSKSKELGFWQKIRIASAGLVGDSSMIADIATENFESSVRLQKKINEAKKEQFNIDIEIAEIKNKEDNKKKETSLKTKDTTLQAEKDKAAALESIRKQLIDTEAEERAEKLRLIQEDYAKQIRLAELYYADDTEKKKELEAAQKLALDEQKLKWKEEDAAKELADKEEREALEQEIKEAEAVTEEEERALEVAKVEARYAMLVKAAEDAGISTVKLKEAEAAAIDKINEVESEVELSWAELTTAAKIKLVDKALGHLSTMVDKESAAGKAIAVAKSGINTFQGVTGAMAATPGPAGIAMGAIVGAMGVANILKIVNTKIPSASGKGNVSGGGGSVSVPALPPIPPAFNIVGSSGTNQLADAIGGQSQTPVQAYVVSNDVSTAMELDRNIINGASIG